MQTPFVVLAFLDPPGSPIGQFGRASNMGAAETGVCYRANIRRWTREQECGTQCAIAPSCALRRLARGERPQYADRTLGRIGECVSDEGVVAGLAKPHLEDAPAANRDVHRLHADFYALALVNPLEDSAHHVEGADPVGPGVHDVETKQLVGFDLYRVGRVLASPAVEDHMVRGEAQELLPLQAAGAVGPRLGG